MENQKRIAQFTEKLFEVAKEGGPTCGWTEAGDGFVVKSVREFEADILRPRFGHGNYASFVRQLNQYGFHKDRSSEEAIFRNPNFLRDEPERLHLVVRRQAPTAKAIAAAKTPGFEYSPKYSSGPGLWSGLTPSPSEDGRVFTFAPNHLQQPGMYVQTSYQHSYHNGELSPRTKAEGLRAQSVGMPPTQGIPQSPGRSQPIGTDTLAPPALEATPTKYRRQSEESEQHRRSFNWQQPVSNHTESVGRRSPSAHREGEDSEPASLARRLAAAEARASEAFKSQAAAEGAQRAAEADVRERDLLIAELRRVNEEFAKTNEALVKLLQPGGSSVSGPGPPSFPPRGPVGIAATSFPFYSGPLPGHMESSNVPMRQTPGLLDVHGRGAAGPPVHAFFGPLSHGQFAQFQKRPFEGR